MDVVGLHPQIISGLTGAIAGREALQVFSRLVVPWARKSFPATLPCGNRRIRYHDEAGQVPDSMTTMTLRDGPQWHKVPST